VRQLVALLVVVSGACTASRNVPAGLADAAVDEAMSGEGGDGAAADAMSQPDGLVLADRAADLPNQDAAPPDDGYPPDTTLRPDLADAYVQPTAACTALASSLPFACTLRGSGKFVVRDTSAAAGTRTLEVQLYFPRGRKPGESVRLVASDSLDDRRFRTYASSPAILAADGTAALELQAEDWDIGAALLPDAKGLRAQVRFGVGLEVEDGVVFLVPVGEAPAPTMVPLSTASWLSPLTGMDLRASAPFEDGALRGLLIVDGDRVVPSRTLPVPPDFGTNELAFALRPAEGGTFPAATALALDAGAVTDIVGRRFQAAAVDSLIPSAQLSDLSFATAPPAGAVAGTFDSSDWPVSNGVLAIPPPTAPGNPRFFSYEVVVGLGPPPAGATLARVRLQSNCGSVYAGLAQVALMDERGEASRIDVSSTGCSTSFKEHVVGIPGRGKLYLVFEHVAFRRSTAPGPDVSSRVFQLDEIRFE
jgi:hypothetical protein